MEADRRQIEHPLFLDFSSRPVPPLKFLLQREYSPVGVVERPSDGITLGRTPWYTELGVGLKGVEAVAVLYQIPRGDGSELLAACIDDTFEPFFKVLSGAEFGDTVTSLTAEHWPEIYEMLRRGNQQTARGRVLCHVVTPGRAQWVVADHLPEDRPDDIPAEQLLDLIGISTQTMLRAGNFAVDLPGVVQAVGGPDLWTQRLSAVADLVGAVSLIGGGLQGGVEADELYDLARAARDAVMSMIELRRVTNVG